LPTQPRPMPAASARPVRVTAQPAPIQPQPHVAATRRLPQGNTQGSTKSHAKAGAQDDGDWESF
ncbi:MAG: hypothetical protein WBG44_03225, partial [Comamonas sp.]